MAYKGYSLIITVLHIEVTIMTISFCGHSKIYYNKDVEEMLYDIIEKLINKEGVTDFLMGGYGNFDKLAAKIVKELKGIYPYINSMLVIPYLDRKYNLELYDCTIYPSLENIPYKFAILKRNQWIIENSDIVVAYVTHNCGGAAKSLVYAQKKKKQIINIAEYKMI